MTDVLAPEGSRWRHTIMYRTDAGPESKEVYTEDIEDLQVDVEAGPHWDAIISITTVRVNHVESERLTVEEALKL